MSTKPTGVAFAAAMLCTLLFSGHAFADEVSSPSAGACHQTQECRTRGLCSDVNGVCEAERDEDCWQSEFCAYGRCHASNGRCVALGPADCASSPACVQSGWCEFNAGECRAPAHIIPEWKSSTQSGGDKSSSGSGGGAMLGIGIALTAVGGIGFFSGIALSASCIDFGHSGSGCDYSKIGPGLILGGLASLGLGIPLLVVGARRVRDSAAAPPIIKVGAGSVGLEFSF
jgi:hypothetical protein